MFAVYFDRQARLGPVVESPQRRSQIAVACREMALRGRQPVRARFTSPLPTHDGPGGIRFDRFPRGVEHMEGHLVRFGVRRPFGKNARSTSLGIHQLDQVSAVGPGHVAERESAQTGPERHQADNHAEVANSVDDERLVCSIHGAWTLDVESDQEVRANPDKFPKHEYHGDVAGQHQSQHAEAKQRQVLKETIVAAGPFEMFAVLERYFVVRDVVQLVMHVAHRVEVNARSNQRHHAKHADGQAIDVVADRQLQEAKATENVVVARDMPRRTIDVSLMLVARLTTRVRFPRVPCFFGVSCFFGGSRIFGVAIFVNADRHEPHGRAVFGN